MDDPQIHRTIEQLDRCWHLLRQRGALREAGRDPGAADVTRPEVVESYEQ